MDFECNSRVEKIPYNGKETIVDGEKYGSMHGNSDRHLQEKLLPYRRLFFEIRVVKSLVYMIK